MKKILLIAAVSVLGAALAQAQTPLIELKMNNGGVSSYTNTGSLTGNGFAENASPGISYNGSGYTGLATDYSFKCDNGNSDIAFGSDAATTTNYPALNGLTAFTAMVWMKIPTNALAQMLPNLTGGPWVGGILGLEGAFVFRFDIGNGAYPNGAFEFDGVNGGQPSQWVDLTTLPVNPLANPDWQFLCFRWDTNGVYKINVGNLAGTLTLETNFVSGVATAPCSNPGWNFRCGQVWYQKAFTGSSVDNVRLYDANLTDAQVLAIYSADVAANNVTRTTNAAPATAQTAIAISYKTGDLTTNYMVQAAGALGSPTTWTTVDSKVGSNGTNTYYEVIGSTNKFFQVLQSH